MANIKQNITLCGRRAVEAHLKKTFSVVFFYFEVRIFTFFMSNSVNFYEFIGFITFNIVVHDLIFVYSFLLYRILVSSVPRATGRRPTLNPKTPKSFILKP